MKNTLSRQINDYIYLNVVLPLKNVSGLEPYSCQNPLIDRDGRVTELEVARLNIPRESFRHQYQRDIARERAPYLIYMRVSGRNSRVVIGKYDVTDHSVTLYRGHVHYSKYGLVIIRQLYNEFTSSYPFGKVETVGGTYLDSQTTTTNNNYSYVDENENDDEDYYDEDY